MTTKSMFVILDGYSMAYRHYHGTLKQQLSAPDGSPTGAVYGFTRQILDIVLKERPEYVAVAFDAGLSGREIIYPEYKATRQESPADFPEQVEKIKAMLTVFNIPILELDGYEADDIIGTMVKKAEKQGVHSRIVTGDGDLLQLITDATDVYLHRPFGGPALYDAAAFHEKYEIQPPQLVDFKALKGDSSDNIPGVRGVGEKTAIPLIQTYGSLEGIYAHLDEIKGAARKKLEAKRDDAFMSYQLAKIQCELEIELDLNACVTRDYDVQQVIPLFEEFGFRSLLRRLRKSIGNNETVVSEGKPQQLSMFGEVDVASGEFDEDLDFAAPIPASSIVESILVLSEQGLYTVVDRLNQAEQIVIDTETTSLDVMSAELVGISLAVNGEQGYYIPVGHIDDNDEQLPLELVLDALREPLTNPKIPKIAHNAAYDYCILANYGIAVYPFAFDTMLAEWVRDSVSSELKLSSLAMRGGLLHENGVLMQDIKDLIGSGKNQRTMAVVPIRKAATYAAEDAAITYRLIEPLRQKLTSYEGAQSVFEHLEMPLVPILSEMQRAGVLLDVSYLKTMSLQLDEQLQVLQEEIYALSGGYGEFNINSPKQLNDVLFGKLNLPRQGIRKTTHGYSTAADVLEKLYDDTGAPILQKILEHRELKKLQSTYVDALPELVNAKTKRLHTSFNQTGTSTGRLSSSNPNLQNIPVRTEIGREVRRAFIVPEGSVLLAVDYSQVELRIMAHMADEPYLKQSFANGEDIHAATAAVVNEIPIEDVTREQRSFAKRVNFGILYGMGAFRLARDSNLTLGDAESFIKTYFERLPNVKQYIEQTKEQLRIEGYVETLLGRRRYFGDVANMRSQDAARAEREAINMPIQGTAADILKKAMIELDVALREQQLQSKMLLQVHDELLLEVPQHELDQTRELVVSVMENAYPLNPKLKANAQVGLNWRDLTAV